APVPAALNKPKIAAGQRLLLPMKGINMKKTIVALTLTTLAALSVSNASAGVSFHIGIPLFTCAPPCPPPVCVVTAPVVVQSPPVYVQPPPIYPSSAPVYVQPAPTVVYQAAPV